MNQRISFLKINWCVVVLCMGLSLSGCMNVATTGAQAIYNRQNLKKSFKDQYITMQANQTLKHKSHAFDNANLDIATLNREVLLMGQVPEVWQRKRAEELVKAIPDVATVYNVITVSAPSSTLTRLSDRFITAKVKGRLIASETVDPGKVKVVTENGTVYLMGTLQPKDADAAVELARTTSGVQSVVKIFSYVHISKR